MIDSVLITYRPTKHEPYTTLYQDGYYFGVADGFCEGIIASFVFIFLFVVIGCVLTGR